MNEGIFSGRKIVIATMHGKERVMSPVLESELGLVPVTFEGLDTDAFGTFSGEIERKGTQLDAARAKALYAAKLAGVDLAVASEGSFDAHPANPFVQSNLELVLLVDLLNDFEVRGYHRTSKTNMDGTYVKSVEEALLFADQIGFPDHGIIVRPSKKSKRLVHKNIHTREDLERVVSKLLSRFFTRKIYIETDMRAHKNPTRMNAIEHAVRDLVKNCKSLCPSCGVPGYVVSEVVPGLPCAECLTPTEITQFVVYACSKCSHSERTEVTEYGAHADPMYCGKCNP